MVHCIEILLRLPYLGLPPILILNNKPCLTWSCNSNDLINKHIFSLLTLKKYS